MTPVRAMSNAFGPAADKRPVAPAVRIPVAGVGIQSVEDGFRVPRRALGDVLRGIDHEKSPVPFRLDKRVDGPEMPGEERMRR